MKKKLSSDESTQLLGVLEVRFDENAKRHKGIAWTSVQEKLETNPAKLWSLYEMERTEENQTSLVLIKRLVSIFSLIVLPKAPKVAEVVATIMKRWSQGKNTNRKIVPFKWQQIWE